MVCQLIDVFQVAIWYISNSGLTCSLLSAVVPYICVLISLFFVLCVKSYMTDNALEYLNLNHDILSKIAVLVVVGTIICEVLTLLIVYGSLCPKAKIEVIKQLYSIQVGDCIGEVPPIVIYHASLLLLPATVSKILSFKDNLRYFKFACVKKDCFSNI